MYDNFELLSIENPLGPAPVAYAPSVSSTMDVVRDPVFLERVLGSDATAAPHGTVVAAGVQMQGRGTHGRGWETPEDAALLLTIVLHRPADWPLSTIRLGLAVRAYAAAHGVQARVKWPNDVMVGSRKLAGVLCEWQGGVLYCGLGVNVHASPAGHEAVSLREAGAQDLAGYSLELSRLLACVAGYVDPEAGEVRAELSSSLYGAGESVHIRMPDGGLRTGTIVDVDAQGGLVVAHLGKTFTLYAGRIEALFP